MDARSGIATALASARGWMLHSSSWAGLAGMRLHVPNGVQQPFAATDGNMKYCAHERHPPHSNVAASAMAMQKLAIFLNTLIIVPRLHCRSVC